MPNERILLEQLMKSAYYWVEADPQVNVEE